MTVGDVDRLHRLKREAALRALEEVREGMALGLGSGSTAEVWVAELGRRVEQGLKVVGVATSGKVEALARRVGVPLADLDDLARLDLTVDGADEIDRRTFALIKGGGGALLREKLVAVASDREIVIADESKLVETLGERQPLAVEVVRFGWRRVAERVERLGCQAVRREADGQPFVSDEGHYILDCRFSSIGEPERLAGELKAIVGVVEHGLFIGLAQHVIVAGLGGVQVYDVGT